MDDDKDKGRRGPRGPRKPGGGHGNGPRGDRPQGRPARSPAQRRDEAPGRNDSRGQNPREFHRFKTPRPEGRDNGQERGPRARPGRAERDRMRERSAAGGEGATRSERPPRKFDGERPPRRFDGDRPPRKFDGERPPRRFDGDRPPRKFDGERPPRRFDGDRPPRRFDGERPPRKFDGERPPRRFDGDRPPRRREEQASAAEERIAKRLARAGIASRRDAEALVEAGRVKVNGQVLASPAINVKAGDRIEVDGTEIPPVERTRLFLFHKPAGVVTTNRDPEGRRTVFDILPADLPRVVTVGRLDINTEGLLLLTNDGGLSRVLELPATGWLRRYRVRVHGQVDEKSLASLKDGIAVDGVFYGSIEASLDREQGTNAWLTIGLREGKNREVKNILGALGLEVTRLIRISFGPFQLGELAEGAVQELKGRMLRDQLGQRLIEESGANFDAPIAQPFSNSPMRGERPADEDRPRRERAPAEPAVGEGGLIKNRKREREFKREDALARLGTKPPRGGFGDKPRFADKGGGKSYGGKSDPRKKRDDDAPAEPHAQRRANVWMAPGARPPGKKKGAAAFSPLEGERSAKRTEGVGKGSAGRSKKPSPAGATPPGRPFDKLRAATLPSRGREDGAPRGKGPRKGGNADRRR